jgi:hypothetical protein
LAKDAGLFLKRAVEVNPLRTSPRGVRLIRFALLPADANHVVPGIDQTRNQVSAHMSRSANDDRSHFSVFRVSSD